ncbi:MAG: hypothetical protein JST58_00715 [Bacteroidetes bacterium]|nr:hypothetical protein [Bacteroidota bacterium]
MSAKIKLSKEELQLVQNAGIILTKNTIMQKVVSLFGILVEEMKDDLKKRSLPEELIIVSPKISRGENYQGLPYVMLDFPRLFSKEEVFAVRSFFWWGNYFSITLHLHGEYKKRFAPSLLENISLLREKGFWICQSDDPWRHELSADNYTPLSVLDNDAIAQIIEEKPFLKISAKAGLSNWEEAAPILLRFYKDLLSVMAQR